MKRIALLVINLVTLFLLGGVECSIRGQELVVPPADLTTQQYRMTARQWIYLADDDDWAHANVDTVVTMGFTADGDVYLQGLAYPTAPEAWLKGSIVDGRQLVFPRGQYVGHERYAMGYFITQDAEARDIIFDIGRANAVFTIDPGVEVYLLPTVDSDPRQTGSIFEVELRSLQDADTPITPPADMVAEPYTFETFDVMAASEAEFDVAIGFHADSIYLRGVYPELPEAWVAGVVENDEYGAYVVLPRGQFMGHLADETPVYLLGSGCGGTTNDIYLDYDTLNAVLTTNATFVISTDRDAISIPATLGYYERGTFRPGTTGLHQIENGKLKVENETVYDLSGRRVQGNKVTKSQGNSFLPKRVYIQNGKKIVIPSD